MYLIQILLPVYSNKGESFPQSLYTQIRKQLTEQFGGLTAYVRSPAEGLWKEDAEKTVKDDIVIYEVMAEQLDHTWWKSYREQLCKVFEQEALIIRATEIIVL